MIDDVPAYLKNLLLVSKGTSNLPIVSEGYEPVLTRYTSI